MLSVQIQGAIMVASIFQVVIGFTGAIGWMLKYIGPLAISPTISLAGLALFDVATGFASKQWWITLVYVCNTVTAASAIVGTSNSMF